jgi:CheY-like chemotaxis protein
MSWGDKMPKKKILIIDDEVDLAQLTKMNLERSGLYEVSVANNGDKGLEMASQAKFDAFIVDFVMPGMDGTQVCRAIKVIYPDAAIIIMSGKLDKSDKWKEAAFSNTEGQVFFIDKAEVEKELGIVNYLYKPFDYEEVLSALEKAFADRNC